MPPSTRRPLVTAPRRRLPARPAACAAVLTVVAAAACRAPTEPAPRARYDATRAAPAADGSEAVGAPADSAAAPGSNSEFTVTDTILGRSGSMPWW